MRNIPTIRTAPVGIENDGRFVVVDCRCSHPEMSKIYNLAFENILRVFDNTGDSKNFNPTISMTCMLRGHDGRMMAFLRHYQSAMNNNPGTYLEYAAAITLLDNTTGRQVRLDPFFISIVGSPDKTSNGINTMIRLEGTEQKTPSVTSVFKKVKLSGPVTVTGALPDLPVSEWLSKAFSKPVVHLFDPQASSVDDKHGNTYTLEFVVKVDGLSYQDSIVCKNQVIAWPEGKIPMRLRLTSSGLLTNYVDLVAVSPLYVKTVGYPDGSYSASIILRGEIVNVE